MKQNVVKIIFILFILQLVNIVSAQDLLTYQPKWIKNGFATAGSTHEPWMFMVRRNSPKFGPWQKEFYEYQQSEEFIKKLAQSGVTVYHLFGYKGYGFEAEKNHLEKAKKAAALAHKYGLKVDTYVQWNSFFYETFLNEVPEAEIDLWYEVDENGKPLSLPYGYASYRRRICMNSDAYFNYFKENILKYLVEEVETDFIHFDNFGYNNVRDIQYNPQTIKAFRKYVEGKYSTDEMRIDRFGFINLSQILPPVWQKHMHPDSVKVLEDPLMQEWCDFRTFILEKRLLECIEYVREINKEVAIEINGTGLFPGKTWQIGINHGSIMRYINASWSEGGETGWDNKIIGQWRHMKIGRVTNTYLLTHKCTPLEQAENMAINRTPSVVSGWQFSHLSGNKNEGLVPDYMQPFLDFWHKNKSIYNDVEGMEKVAVLRTYPSMAYNLNDTHHSVEVVEQSLYENQIPFDIIFDEQLKSIDKYSILILANQESLHDSVISTVKEFVKNGGVLIATENSGKFDEFRRLRRSNGFVEIFGNKWNDNKLKENTEVDFEGGKAFFRTTNQDNKNVLDIISNKQEKLPLKVSAPNWVGVSHDKSLIDNKEFVHLVNYREDKEVQFVELEYEGKIKNAWMVSPYRENPIKIMINTKKENSIFVIPKLKLYEVVVIEK